jgi:hypothetical protein
MIRAWRPDGRWGELMSPMIALRVASLVGVLVLANSSVADSLIIYPAKGQSTEQQSKDEGECQQWAKKTTGIDPLALASQASQPAPVSAAPATPPPEKGQRVRGAARGAAAGAAVGAIAGDAGKGAAIGATAGTVAGGSRKRRQERESAAASQQAGAQAEQQAQTQSANTQAQLATFNKAYAACLEGRGYTVK